MKKEDLPNILPVFPLSNFIIFPRTTVPLNIFEPIIDNVEATVQVSPDTNEMNATIQYDISGIPAPTQIVDVLLFPART